MKRIMISYAAYGGGHLAAAQNIKEYIEANHPEVEVFLFDFMRYINKSMDKIGKKTYQQITTNIPWFWGKIYYHTQDPIFEKILALSTKVLSYKLRKIMKEFNPDLIISTHFFFSHMCGILKKQNKITAKIATIITDYGEDPYNEWISEHNYIDYIFCAHNEMRNYLITQGVDEKKLHATGIPISSKFLINYDKQKILYNLGFSSSKKTILFFGGGELGIGTSKVVNMLDSLSKDFSNIQIIAIAGKNENLKIYFEKVVDENKKNDSIKVLGFTDRVAEFMAISDLVITKPGRFNIN